MPDLEQLSELQESREQIAEVEVDQSMLMQEGEFLENPSSISEQTAAIVHERSPAGIRRLPSLDERLEQAYRKVLGDEMHRLGASMEPGESFGLDLGGSFVHTRTEKEEKQEPGILLLDGKGNEISLSELHGHQLLELRRALAEKTALLKKRMEREQECRKEKGDMYELHSLVRFVR